MKDKDKETLDKLALDTAPCNADEFYMGMYLALLLEVIDNYDAESEETLNGILDGAESALSYWRNKYDEYIMAAGVTDGSS